MRSLLQLQADMSAIGTELANANDEVVRLATNGAASMDDIKAAETKRDEIQKRFNLIKDAHDSEQTAAAQRVAQQQSTVAASDGDKLIAAKAAFYRAVLAKRPVSDDIRAQLQAIPANDASGGVNFLPTTLTNELVHEPFATNPLRDVAPITSITGLTLPRIAFTVDDDAFITDADTAAELEMTGDSVAFGRFKTKVKARIADTVYHGSDVDLVNFVENALRSGLAAKEKKVAFAAVVGQGLGEEHMSFYQDSAVPGTPAIKEVEGANLFAAITAAIADLPDEFRENAKVVMKYSDYVAILSALANGNAAFFTAPPEQILGKPAIFCDSATTPIVGDFSYFRINYDIAPVYDTDKDVDAGEYLFVLTAWFDTQRLLNSAFRLAVVVPPVG